jgi:hypothetical protein
MPFPMSLLVDDWCGFLVQGFAFCFALAFPLVFHASYSDIFLVIKIIKNQDLVDFVLKLD